MDPGECWAGGQVSAHSHLDPVDDGQGAMGGLPEGTHPKQLVGRFGVGPRLPGGCYNHNSSPAPPHRSSSCSRVIIVLGAAVFVLLVVVIGMGAATPPHRSSSCSRVIIVLGAAVFVLLVVVIGMGAAMQLCPEPAPEIELRKMFCVDPNTGIEGISHDY
ncbi:UNVERIFIED_CONTAM: hypothetical protein FKN15_017012 [Acipenser sinensis]